MNYYYMHTHRVRLRWRVYHRDTVKMECKEVADYSNWACAKTVQRIYQFKLEALESEAE